MAGVEVCIERNNVESNLIRLGNLFLLQARREKPKKGIVIKSRNRSHYLLSKR